MARAGASEVVRAFGRRHGSSWSHGGVVQQSAQRYKAENMDKAVAAFARHHNMEVPKRLRDQKSSEEGGGRGMAKSVAGVVAVGGLMGGLIAWLNEEVKHKPSPAVQAVKKVVKRVSQVGLGM